MKCLSCELLELAAPIIQAPAADFSRQTRILLQKLISHCGLCQALFFRCFPPCTDRDLVKTLHLTAEGSGPVPPFPFDPLTAADVLKRRQWRRKDSALYLPVATAGRAFGVLVLAAESGPNDLDSCLPAFRHLAAYLAQVAGEERAGAEAEAVYALTGRFLQGLDRNRTLPETIQMLLPILLEESGAAAVMLRPIYGGTLVDRPYYRIHSDYQPFKSELLGFEEALSRRTLAEDGRPVLVPPAAAEGTGLARPSMGAVILPLNFQQRPLGILILLHSREPEIPALSWAAEATGPLENLAALFAHGLDRVALRDRLEDLTRDSGRKWRETSLLYRISRAMHSTLRLNDLVHLILSAATVPEGGGFERAILFMVNERADTLQGMLGVTQETATLVLPPGAGHRLWDRPEVTDQTREAQHQAPFCRKVLKQRLSLDPQSSALGRAVSQKRVIFVTRPEREPEAGRTLAEDLNLTSYACAPLHGQDGTLGVLVVDNPMSAEPIAANRLEFLEVFASQAGVAMENSILMHRLESAHLELKNTQDRLIQGEKMAVLGEMAASVAHELKNPLVAIGGFAQRLSRLIETDDEGREYAEIIAREVRRMEEMLGNILNFSKRQVLCFGECRIERIVEEALALERHALSGANVRLRLELDPDLPTFQGDEQKLRQVVVNLITNARHAMPRGGKLTLRAGPDLLRGKPAIRLEIEDTGGGIAQDILGDIFNPFFTTKERGTGLGLSISQRIIEQHQGEIEARNRNQGAAFIIRLPVALEFGLS